MGRKLETTNEKENEEENENENEEENENGKENEKEWRAWLKRWGRSGRVGKCHLMNFSNRGPGKRRCRRV